MIDNMFSTDNGNKMSLISIVVGYAQLVGNKATTFAGNAQWDHNNNEELVERLHAFVVW